MDTARWYSDVTQNCVCFRLRRTGRAITALYDEKLRPAGLRVTQFTVLIAAARMSPVGITDLAAVLEMDRTTLTRNLKPLEESGLVQMSAGKDRRVHQVAVTAAGEEALAKARPLWEEAQRCVADALAGDEWSRLHTDLETVAQAARST